MASSRNDSRQDAEPRRRNASATARPSNRNTRTAAEGGIPIGKSLLSAAERLLSPRRENRPKPDPKEAEERKRRRQALHQQSRELARGPMDVPFCLLVLLLTAVGLVILLSASFPSAYYSAKTNHDPTYYFRRQASFAVMGVAAMLFIGKFNYQRFRAFGKPMMYFSLFLLLLVPVFGIVENNARRWLSFFGLFTFQPSEVAKVAVILFFADSISRKRDKMRTFRDGIVPYVLWLIVIGGLVASEPHLSGAILIMGTGAAMMLVGGIHLGWVIGALGAAAGGLYFVLFVIGYNTSRITSWLNPWEDARGDGWQLSQSLISIGSGGLLGVGLGKSRQKFLFLPEEHNDFIFSVACEELGLIGAGLIMLLFAVLILRGFWIALHARDRFGSLLVVGVMTQVGLQTFLNIGVASGLLPTTGISLPFFSYGGTALMIQLAEMGIVLSVSRQMKLSRNG